MSETQRMPANLQEDAWCWVRFELSDGTPSNWMPARRSGNCMETPGWRTPNVLEFGDLIQHEAQQAQAPIDPDGEQSRAGFRAFDEAQVAQWATPWQVWREAVKWAAQQAQAPGWQLVPVEPTPGLLMSMAMRFDHGLGCPGYYDQFPRFPGDSHQRRLEGVLTQMRQIYEEVSGAGFYRPEREESYKALAAPQQGSKT